jgi:hypothetical protein
MFCTMSRPTTPPDPRKGPDEVAGRSWQEQWRAVMGGLMEVGRCHSGQHADPSSTTWHAIVVQFCRDCYIADPDVPFPVRVAVESHVAACPYIRLTGCVANPEQNAHETVARVHSAYELQPPRTIMRIEWEHEDGTTGTHDALDVAVQAVSEWRTFLVRNKLY